MQSSDPQSIVLEAPFPRNTKILHLKKGPSVEGVWKMIDRKVFIQQIYLLLDVSVPVIYEYVSRRGICMIYKFT